MKKLSIVLVVSVILLLCLSACGGKPDDISDQAYEIGCAALESIDEFLSKEIDYDILAERLSRNLDRLDDASCDGEHDLSVSHYITLASHEALMKEIGNGTLAKVTECRNKLAETIGKPKR